MRRDLCPIRGFNEAGAGGADLQVAGRSETWFSVSPAVEVGGELELADRTLVRPSLKLGIAQFVAGPIRASPRAFPAHRPAWRRTPYR